MISDGIDDLVEGKGKKFHQVSKLVSDFVDTHTTRLLLLFTVMCIMMLFYLASQKLFWNDELYTLYFTRLTSWSDLWNALSTGADQIPPTFVLLTKLSLQLFGTNHRVS